MISWEDSVKKRIYTGRKITSYGCSSRDLKQFSNSHDIVVQACHLWNSQFYVFAVTLHTASLNWYQIMCFLSVQMLHSFWSLDKVCIICTINQSLEWLIKNHFQIPVILNFRLYFEIQMKKPFFSAWPTPPTQKCYLREEMTSAFSEIGKDCNYKPCNKMHDVAMIRVQSGENLQSTWKSVLAIFYLWMEIIIHLFPWVFFPYQLAISGSYLPLLQMIIFFQKLENSQRVVLASHSRNEISAIWCRFCIMSHKA